MERAEICHPFPSARKESGSRFAETNRVYLIDHKKFPKNSLKISEL